MHFIWDTVRISLVSYVPKWSVIEISFDWQLWCFVKLCNVSLFRLETTTGGTAGKFPLRQPNQTVLHHGELATYNFNSCRFNGKTDINTVDQSCCVMMAQEWADHLRVELQIDHSQHEGVNLYTFIIITDCPQTYIDLEELQYLRACCIVSAGWAEEGEEQ